MIQPRLKHFGWGREGEGLTSAEEAFVLGRIEQQFGPLATPTANHFLIMCAGLSAITATHPTSLLIRVLRRRWRQCSIGRAAPRRA